MIAVDIQKLLVRYGDAVVLDYIDLRILPGELFLLLGPSGCGKTTLLRCIAGFTPADSGSIFFGDEDVTRLAPDVRNTGMVFQSFALWPHLDVAENVAFGLRERKIAKREIAERVQQALDAVRMGERKTSRIDQLSGGEQQRVALARALVIKPRCLLLDEPLSNLDARLRHSMRDEIRRVCKEHGLTAIYVTHDQKEALAIADRIAVMHAGRVLQVGTPAEIYRRPASRTVAAFVGEPNLIEGAVTHVEADEVRTRTEVGELVSLRSAALFAEVGGKVWVSVRPECFSLQSAPFDSHDIAPNTVRATLESTTYLGEIAEHRLLAGSVRLRVYEMNPQIAARDHRAQVRVTAAPGDIVLLPFEEPHV